MRRRDNTGAMCGPLAEHLLLSIEDRTKAHGQFMWVILHAGFTDHELGRLGFPQWEAPQ